MLIDILILGVMTDRRGRGLAPLSASETVTALRGLGYDYTRPYVSAALNRLAGRGLLMKYEKPYRSNVNLTYFEGV